MKISETFEKWQQHFYNCFDNFWKMYIENLSLEIKLIFSQWGYRQFIDTGVVSYLWILDVDAARVWCSLCIYILVMQCFWVGYRGICHVSLIFSVYIQASSGSDRGSYFILKKVPTSELCIYIIGFSPFFSKVLLCTVAHHSYLHQ